MRSIIEVEGFLSAVQAAVVVAEMHWQRGAACMVAATRVPYEVLLQESSQWEAGVYGPTRDFLEHWIEAGEPADWIPEDCRKEAFAIR